MMKRSNKNRLLAMLLGMCMVASTVGCGQNNETTSVESDGQKSTEVSEKSETTTDNDVVSEEKHVPITTDPVTISVLTTRQYATTATEGNDLWFFRYLEYWLNEQGYNVTIDVTQTFEKEQQIPLLLGSDSLPDIVWGIPLKTQEAVTYGVEEGMILDWTPYLNEETMPNLMSLLDKYPEAYAGSFSTDGGVYGLPNINSRGWGQKTALDVKAGQTFINTKWLEACGLEMPTTMDGVIDMLRAFKNMELADGQEAIPLIETAERLFENWIWACLGYYGANTTTGADIAIKDGEVYLPAATEDYGKYVTIMNTLYEEGLVPEDYLTMDTTTLQGLASTGVCGAFAYYGLQPFPDTYEEWISLPLVQVDGIDINKAAGTMGNAYTANSVWVSSETKYPELIAYIMDYAYSPEGSVAYYLGPQKGQHPLDMVDGWYYNEEGMVTYDEVESGAYTSWDQYACEYIFPTYNGANYIDYAFYSKELAGIDYQVNVETWTDSITGKEVPIEWKVDYTKDNMDGYARHIKTEAWKDTLTAVRLPGAQMSAEDITRAGELEVILRDYVLGLECGNCYPDGRKTMREKGMLKFIKPGESKEYHVKIVLSEKGYVL